MAKYWILVFSVVALLTKAQPQTENVVIVTLDGFRWQEFFRGADPKIIDNKKFSTDSAAVKYWHADEEIRRQRLLPFIWTTVAQQGQLYGNRDYKNKIRCTNKRPVSFPGYSEMLVGYADDRVSHNDRKINPNTNVLEYINRHYEFKNKVAVFATWDIFPYIVGEGRNDLYVHAGYPYPKDNTEPHPDDRTFSAAFDFLTKQRPRVLMISFDGTDTHAHNKQYNEYLNAAHKADSAIALLWQWIQSQPDYKDKTTLIITTDHGRGNGKHRGWRKHGTLWMGSKNIWLAVMGPDTPASGELKTKGLHYQNQIAKTIAALLNINYQNKKPVGEIIQWVFKEKYGDAVASGL